MKRVLSALILIPAVAALVLYAPPSVYAIVVALLVTLALYEFYSLGNKIGGRCQTVIGLAGGVLLLAALWLRWPHPVEILLAGTVIGGGLSLFSEASLEEAVRGWMTTTFGWFYVALPLALLYSLRFDSFGETGPKLLFFLLVLQWLQDTAAYYVGTSIGHHKIAPRFSPQKSVEGSVAGLVAATLGGLFFHYWVFEDSHLGQVLFLSLTLGIAGQLSDIAESLFKRAAGVKDSSNLIPGHGGVLDRVDGLLFATPLLWIVLNHWSL